MHTSASTYLLTQALDAGPEAVVDLRQLLLANGCQAQRGALARGRGHDEVEALHVRQVVRLLKANARPTQAMPAA